MRVLENWNAPSRRRDPDQSRTSRAVSFAVTPPGPARSVTGQSVTLRVRDAPVAVAARPSTRRCFGLRQPSSAIIILYVPTRRSMQLLGTLEIAKSKSAGSNAQCQCSPRICDSMSSWLAPVFISWVCIRFLSGAAWRSCDDCLATKSHPDRCDETPLRAQRIVITKEIELFQIDSTL